MSGRRPSLGWRLALRLRRLAHALAGRVTLMALRLLRRTDPDRISRFAGRMMRRIGPWLPEHRVGRANLAAAYPEKSAAEIEEILGGVWDNLGRVGAEYAHLDRLWDYDFTRARPGRMEDSDESLERAKQIAAHGGPALIFSSHLANWELSALAAAAVGLEAHIIYRAPNIGDVAAAIRKIRSIQMGPLIASGPDTPFRAARVLEEGGRLAMLVDQHFTRGVAVNFFGRPCKANPMIARLARHFECPIHGIRVIRRPGGRFKIDLTEPLSPPRATDGRIDVPGTMQLITSVIEGWIREHPEQWLWVHRRWR